MGIRLALYQPDIPQNTGTILRLGACMGIGVDVIEPCGFLWDEKRMRRSGMDYLGHVDLVRHGSWQTFERTGPARIVLLSTRASVPYTGFSFCHGDVLLLGSEGGGVPRHIHETACARIRIPMVPSLRSLNVALSAAMVSGEALRQLRAFPGETPVA